MYNPTNNVFQKNKKNFFFSERYTKRRKWTSVNGMRTFSSQVDLKK
jgi:hypothetical protein